MSEIPPANERVLEIAIGALKRERMPNAAELVELLKWSADEILRLLEEHAWQPIETLPDDGSFVLLAFDGLPYPVVGNHKCWSYKEGGFRATHWMRAPKLPREHALDELVAQSEALGLYDD